MPDQVKHMPADSRNAQDQLSNGHLKELAADASNIGDEVMGILSDVEKQLNRLRSAKREQDVEVASLAQRAAALDKDEADLAQRSAKLHEEQQALESLERELARERESFESQRASAAKDAERSQSELREQQQSVEAQSAQMAQRESELARLSQSLQQKQQEVEQRDSELRQREQSLAGERRSLESQQSSLQQSVKQSEGRIRELTLQLDQANASLEARTTDCDAAERIAAELRERVAKLDQSLAEAAAKIEQVQADALEMSGAVEKERDAARSTANATQAKLTEAEQQIRVLHSGMQSMGDQLAQTKQQLEAHKQTEQARAAEQAQREQALAHSQKQLAAAIERAAAAEQQQSTAQSQVAELQSRLAAVSAQREACSERLTSLEAQLAQRESQLTDAQKKLKLAGEKIAKFGEAINEQAEQLERGAAAMSMVEQQQRTIERLTQELAEARTSGDVDGAKRKDARIQELTEALRQARGQTAGDPNVAALEHRISQQEKELHQLRLNLENANVELKRSQQSLEEANKIASERRASEGGSNEHVQRLTAEVARLESELLKAQQSDQTETLQLKVAELEALLEKAREVAKHASKTSTDSERDVQEKAQRVARVAKHLQRRHQRLVAIRRTLKQRGVAHGSAAATTAAAAPVAAARPAGSSMLEEHANQMRQLEKRRRELIELKAILAESEKKMLHRWARPRAIAVVTWLVMIAGVVGAGSWFAADHVFPATVNAYVNLEATGKKSGPVSEIQAQQWANWHQQLLQNGAFHQVIADRLKQRNVASLATPEAVSAYLTEQLGVDASQKGRMRLTLSGQSESEAVSNLDVITSSMVTESSRQLSTREGEVWASVPAARMTNGEVKYASLDPVPVEDNRLVYAGAMFAGSYVIALALAWLVYTKLLRSKRVFDEQTSSDGAQATGAALAAA
jgi:chromosome segregation ATPase